LPLLLLVPLPIPKLNHLKNYGGAEPISTPPLHTHKLLSTSLPMIRPPALGLSIGLRHISPGLGRPIVFPAIAVVHIATRIQPNQPRTTTRRHSLRSG
jgi:hypothetical protein